MTQDDVLICRRCKMAAQVEFANEEIVSIACPSCGTMVEGAVAREVYLNQARYLAVKEAQNSFKQAFRKTRSVRYKPSRINDPGGPFIIGKPES